MSKRTPEPPYPRAVRWANREIRRSFKPDYTRWHITDNGTTTRCGLRVLIGAAITPLPQDDDIQAATCRRCLRSCARGGLLGGQRCPSQ
jgi:hypothetical protein